MLNGREELRGALLHSADYLDQYGSQRRRVEEAVFAYVELPSGKIDQVNCLPYRQVDPLSPWADGVMYMAAVAYRGYLYRDERSARVSFGQIWSRTELAALADKSQRVAEEIVPTVEGAYTKCDLVGMKRHFEAAIRQGKPEEIVVTGLNGAGKTTGIKALLRFINLAGINVRVSKFPRYDTQPVGPIITQILKGQYNFAPEALQMLMIADALDARTSQTGALQINDRHPTIEPLVYAPEKMVPLILASQEMFENPRWVFVMDRHPGAAQQSVNSRGGEKRIFERQREDMVEQVVRYATLTALPGVRWVNNDADPKDPGMGIELTKRRLVGAVITSGVLQRAMVRQEIAINIPEAGDKLMDIYACQQEDWVGVK